MRRLRPVALLLLAACGSWQRVGTSSVPTPDETLTSLFDMPTVYRGMGRLAAGSPLPFVGTVAFAAGPGDSVKAILGLSIENQALSFQKDGASFLARYRVEMFFESSTASPVRYARDEEVRVSAFAETMRNDESILFQQLYHLTPGAYRVTVVVRDLATGRQSQSSADFTAPEFGPGSFTAPILAYQVTGRRTRDQDLSLVLSPRGTVAYGGDTLLALVEGYGYTAPAAVPFEILDNTDSVIVRDTLRFSGGRPVEAQVVRIVPDSQPLGELRLEVGAGADRKETTALVSFSGAWILTNYDEMVDLLRYFGHDDQVRALRKAPEADRARLWQEFYRSTDPVPNTPENEALNTYFGRMAIANQRFTDEDRSGWRTDRGMVFITLGEPDEILNASAAVQAGTIRWTYVQLRLELYFVDETGSGRFLLTSDSRNSYEQVLSRVRRGAS